MITDEERAILETELALVGKQLEKCDCSWIKLREGKCIYCYGSGFCVLVKSGRNKRIFLQIPLSTYLDSKET